MEDTDYSFLSRTERYEAAVRKEGYVQKKYEELGITSQADKYFYGWQACTLNIIKMVIIYIKTFLANIIYKSLFSRRQ